ncbi:pentatricopeptide repeat-containing protein At5g66500, mitochondrial [Ziziphus jujuba]|uniref:Pentatricopeptide repeat-containing protein At5g66500, mitochondrial n=1 Tax=Ziziphus jujuba TaxID=326968 RepID=A0A6P4A4I7_ZIZJJ|nr:pentatricopeptide repeat-containing protein At5g66500, mitochondrial [Ziziphus jujuba]
MRGFLGVRLYGFWTHKLSNAHRDCSTLYFATKSERTGTIKSLHTHHLFDEVPNRDVYSINSILASYTRNRDFSATWDFFCGAHRKESKLDAKSFTPILVACSALSNTMCGKQVHCLMIKTGTESGIVTKTALMDMYSRYCYLDDSVKIFEEMEFKDVVTWNALLSSFLRHGLVQEAFAVFKAMRRDRVEFSEFTLCSVLKACAFLKALRQGKQVHALVVIMGRDVVLGTALIDFYSDVGHFGEAIKVYSGLDCRKDDIMRNSLIFGCVQNRKYEEVFPIMRTMKPNMVALTSTLTACSELSNLWTGKQIHCVAMRHDFTSETQLCNALLDMYAKCGKISDARSLFNGICNKDVVSWTSMINAYGSHGHGLEALDLFKKMGEKRSGVLPNSVTFLTVLSACGHSGLVDEGRECFNSMREKYSLCPGIEHYACLIDMLGRAGQIDEMWYLFYDMVKDGIVPPAAIWIALLNASGYNLDANRGEFAAKQLLQLEPNKPENYILVSNFYAAVGRWDCVDKFRSAMGMKGLIKEAGSSWVTTVSQCHGNAIAFSV